MMLFRNLKIRTKIILVLTSVAVLAVGINGYIGYESAAKSLEVESFNKLTAIRELKASQIEEYFNHISNQLVSFSTDQTIIAAMVEFKKGFLSIKTDLSLNDEQTGRVSSRLHKYYENIYIPELNKNLEAEVSLADVWPQDSRAILLQSLYVVPPQIKAEIAPPLGFEYRETSYNRAYQKYDPIIRLSLEESGFYDVLLVDHESGNIVYSASREVDYGTSLLSGPYRNTNLAKVFRAVQAFGSRKQVQLVDFAPYPPSYNTPESFIASPIYDGNHQLGVLIFQVQVDRINDIMTNEQAWAKVGQGESEETYIVGSDYTLRNQSRSFIENYDKYFTLVQEIGLSPKTIKMIKNLNSTIALHKVRSAAIDAALQGEVGTGTFVDYRGERVLSSYKPLAIPGVNWVIMSEVDEAEALAPAGVLLNKMLLTFFASIVTIVILAVYFARSITRPLSVLQENAKELAEGNLNIDIKTDGHDEIGDLARSFIVMRNSIKQLVGNLRDYGEQLEGRVAVRTEELHQAREVAEEANRAKSRFLANMSHELRTPMNAIIGYSEMIMEESEDLDQLEFVPDLKKIQGAGKHLLSLINDILDISKIEAGRMDLYLETFDVEQMLREIESTVIPLTEKRGNQLVLDSCHPLGEITTDLTKVRQALLNLISNAAKFTENGTVILSTQRKIIDSQEWIEFQVTDSGIGIAENKLGILFDEFTQADDSTTRNYGGTGLGLAITKRFCEMLGGTISVKSELGEGTTFTICLPALLTPPVDMEEGESGGAAGESAGSVVPPAASKRPLNTILVIDDDPDMLDMMVRFLQKEDYQVITASSGEEGLLFAKEFQPMVITLDVLMPQVDGWDVLKLLKSDPETTDIPVIMLTLTDDRSMGLALGAIEYLNKPVDRNQLLKILNRYCPDQPARPILVLEDDTTMREMLCRTLTKEGWGVREASNGKVALEQIRQEIPGMILLDLLMPIMDGFTFLKELRKEAAWRDIPVLVITSKDISLEEKRLLEEKVVTILQKGASTRQNLLEQVSLTIKHFVPKKDD